MNFHSGYTMIAGFSSTMVFLLFSFAAAWQNKDVY